MSTAFLVDNILNDDKDEVIDSMGSTSGSDDSDSEHNSDLKDSLCDSPKSYTSINNHNSSLSDDDLLRSYTMIQDNQPDFGCGKCGHFNDNHKLNSENNEIKCEKCGLHSEFLTSAKDTLLKETSNKPVLKFSVSAILSDTKKRDCVKVRNGKRPS